MKKTMTLLLLAALTAASAHADTPLTIGKVALIGVGGPCWDDTIPDASTLNSTFTLNGVSGNGTLTSSSVTVVNNSIFNGGNYSFYRYSLDLSGMTSPGSHCISLLIHFGTPVHCVYDVLLLTNAVATKDVVVATLAPYGDIRLTFPLHFGSGCLFPGEIATGIGMLSDSLPKANYITVIDRDLGGNLISSVNVPAIVPDVPPNWAFPPPKIPYSTFQGNFTSNSVPKLPLNGAYDLSFNLVNAGSNGLPVSPTVTQTVQVVNGLFTMPLPFDPNVFTASPRWLSLSARPSGNGSFTPLNPPLALTPAPQALYAYSAGVVADLGPGQAVTSLNGLTDAVILQGGNSIFLGTNGNTLTISAMAGSDRNIKTDFTSLNLEEILAKLAGLPIQGWRFTNEVAGVRHVGPMAQDFKATFGLGQNEKFIEFVDAQGVALAAIQGLNQKLNEKDAEIQQLKESVAQLKAMVSQLAKTQTR